MRHAVLAAAAMSFAATAAAAQMAPDQPARIEVLPIPSITLTDQQFLTGNSYGRPVTIGGVLSVAQGTGRLPLVVLLPGSGGATTNIDPWQDRFLAARISTLVIDSFAGRGITSTVNDQTQLGRLNGILDLYRALEVIADHPRVDPTRIAVMGFSRGGVYALYSATERFNELWNRSGIVPAAFIPFYPVCVTTYQRDTELVDRPVRMFHGTADDWVHIDPCRDYLARLTAAGENVTQTEIEGATHAFDLPNYPIGTPQRLEQAQTTHCVLQEDANGVILNSATGQPFSYADACVGRGAGIAYSPEATQQVADEAIAFLKGVFGMP